MTLDRTHVSIGNDTTQPSTAWENEFINKINDIKSNAVDLLTLRNYINGFFFTFPTTNTKTLIIGSGSCLSDDGLSAINTNQTTIFIPGSLDTGTVANNTWYYVWVVKSSKSENVRFIISLSDTNPFVPSGYSAKRLIGAVRTTSATGDIRTYTQAGNSNTRDFIQYDMTSIVTNATPTSDVWTTLDVSAFTPISTKARQIHIFGLLYQNGTATAQSTSTLKFRDGTSTSTIGKYIADMRTLSGTPSATGDVCNTGILQTDSSGLISYNRNADANEGTPTVSIYSMGFRINL